MESQRKAKGPGRVSPLRKSGSRVPRDGGAGPGRSGSRLLEIGLGKSSRLILAGLLFAASTWWALTRFSRPDPFLKPALLSFAWWTQPLEVNAPARLPVVSGTLTSIAIAGDGKAAYVAGQQGLLLRYKASSQEWEHLAIPDSLAAGAAPDAAPDALQEWNGPSKPQRAGKK